MTSLEAIGYAIDLILATGAIAVTIVAALAAAIPIGLGYRAGTETAIRWHGRQLARRAEAFIRHPAVRAHYLNPNWKEDR